ncbi:hypothetical protein [Agriterribacter sp.]|uniref:hypothetical protein n=1 Tax=Agriterribacter sp. TaxID=2821509 RepID=UPI002CBB6570|nr:hypothetical protein [Agriterribacter sp.]HRO47062.1 hypothetical protein [Agriterribacter sp.]HRQ19028.1 hypothetical protein [Agriterribacter sp.]
MKIRNNLTLCLLLFALWGCNAFQKGQQAGNNNEQFSINSLPHNIYIEDGNFHVQGVAVDTKRGYAYFSFTTSLVKTNLKGEVIGSVDGFLGHLGCLDINPGDGRIYASLEYKNDKIGKGILQGLGNKLTSGDNEENSFYIAIFDGEKITRPGMNAEESNIISTVYLKEVVDDYNTMVTNRGKQTKHRYGCSGIDGIAFGPQFGQKQGKNLLNLAYGIYGDTSRTDNDYQVILQYDVNSLQQHERPLSQSRFNVTGPDKPLNKYFLYTGNTTYGIQNLEYDANTGYWFAAVYPGKKPGFPNYSLFAINGSESAELQALKGFDNSEKGKVLQLAKAGIYDEQSGIYGWHYAWGATGMHSLSNGYFYISQNGTTENKKQYCNLQLYRWTDQASNPFEAVK